MATRSSTRFPESCRGAGTRPCRARSGRSRPGMIVGPRHDNARIGPPGPPLGEGLRIESYRDTAEAVGAAARRREDQLLPVRRQVRVGRTPLKVSRADDRERRGVDSDDLVALLARREDVDRGDRPGSQAPAPGLRCGSPARGGARRARGRRGAASPFRRSYTSARQSRAVPRRTNVAARSRSHARRAKRGFLERAPAKRALRHWLRALTQCRTGRGARGRLPADSSLVAGLEFMMASSAARRTRVSAKNRRCRRSLRVSQLRPIRVLPEPISPVIGGGRARAACEVALRQHLRTRAGQEPCGPRCALSARAKFEPAPGVRHRSAARGWGGPEAGGPAKSRSKRARAERALRYPVSTFARESRFRSFARSDIFRMRIASGVTSTSSSSSMYSIASSTV